MFSSLSAPVVEARTCAKTRQLLILSASRCRLRLLHAGVIDPVQDQQVSAKADGSQTNASDERKTQGPGLSGASSVGYQPTPKPSALIELHVRRQKRLADVPNESRRRTDPASRRRRESDAWLMMLCAGLVKSWLSWIGSSALTTSKLRWRGGRVGNSVISGGTVNKSE